jgi:hypothetical protein
MGGSDTFLAHRRKVSKPPRNGALSLWNITQKALGPFGIANFRVEDVLFIKGFAEVEIIMADVSNTRVGLSETINVIS